MHDAKTHCISVGVVIPTLNAASSIVDLLKSLNSQSIKPDEVLVVDSSSDDDTVVKAKMYGATVRVIPRKEFNHGLTRHKAVLELPFDYVLFLTQDALPVDNAYIEKITAPLIHDSNIAIASGRQIPKSDARRSEQLVREFNYSATSFVRTKSDIDRLGIKTYFNSDVCSAYRRDIYLRLGGFGRCNTNEDMLLAAKCINNGYGVAYVADAKVYHSHNFSLRQQFHRNKEIGRFLQHNQKVLGYASELGEGKRMLSFVVSHLLKEREYTEILRFGFDCMARLLGNRIGRIQSVHRLK
ncbi:MAG: glycosyltransferase family 2 protein [Bifidobacterium sp.]|nr:glycosyltransferase family 2 protein [Bifidobacterium sp.]